jgi:phosphoribosylformylglycinamidine synthase
MGDACRRFGTPVTGGNVSFYNQSAEDGPVFPTPVIGMVGLIDDFSHRMTLHFKREGDLLVQVGRLSEDMNSSIYLQIYHNISYSPAPEFDLEEEVRMQNLVRRLIRAGLVQSAHDLSEGGLFIAALESAITGGKGFSLRTVDGLRKDGILFGEAQGRVLLSIRPEDWEPLRTLAEEMNVPVHVFGEVTAEGVSVDGQDYGNIGEWTARYDHALADMMEGSIA